MQKKKLDQKSRRSFIKKTSTAMAGFYIVPRHVLGGVGYTPPSDKLNLAVIGAGGKGKSDILRASGYNEKTGKTRENVVSLCDVDVKTAQDTFLMFPRVKKYEDYRIMLDEKHKDIDAVVISTPDHMHAPMAMASMALGKHVYVQKPLTHDVFEARQLTEAAEEYGVITQMGNQGSSSDDIARILEWMDAKVIGDVKRIHCWTNRPVWEQDMYRPTEKHDIPQTMNWDLWLGTAPYRPYHDSYAPFNWRGWWDFGTGALGDMACHILDPAIKALQLWNPTHVQAFAPLKKVNWGRVNSVESPPVASTIHYWFAESGDRPPVHLTWYDGGMMPPRPEELADDEPMGDWNGGLIFEGSEGKIMCGCYADNPRLLPSSKMLDFKEPSPSITRIKDQNHQQNWIDAIKGKGKCTSSFDYAGPFTEVVLLGNLALRSLYTTEERMDGDKPYQAYTGEGLKLAWDAENMRITNYEPANQFVRREYRAF